MEKFLPIFVLNVFILSACGSGVPLVGFDEQGKSRFFQIYDQPFSEQIAHLATQMGQSINNVAILNQHKKKLSSLNVHTIAIGIGTVAQIDTAPLRLFLSVEPRVRFIFTDKQNPLIP